ncbi:MAG: mucoidy inhibitor MuiA family protein [Sphingobacteriales bacterium]|nr:mucoidy inhibitor MuiA family protein [Sphingobacteriales bacterium]
MNKKKITLFYCLHLFIVAQMLQAAATEPVNAPTTISNVTVYRQGAKITTTASATVPQGNSEVLLTNLSQYADANSLQISIEGGATLLSATFQYNYGQKQAEPKQAKILQDSIKLLNEKINDFQTQYNIYSQEKNLLAQNAARLGSQNQQNTVVSVAEISALGDYYRKRMFDIEQNMTEATKQKAKTSEQVSRLQSQLNQLQTPASDKLTGEVLLNIITNASSTLKIKCAYVVTSVSWAPLYDLHYNGPDKPLTLTYKAQIYQNIDLDWNNIRLAVATGNPQQNNSRPIMDVQYVDFYRTYGDYTSGESDDGGVAQKREYNMMSKPIPSIPPPREEAPPPAYTVSTSNNELNAVFDIDLLQTIPSDNKPHIVLLTEYQIKGNFQYHTVPKLDNGAFLLAQITDWGQYNLLPGKSNLFLEETYIGQVDINPSVAADTLLLSLGRDERISVKRLQLNEFTKTKFLGTNRIQTFAYEITLRNNKNASIDLEVLDQIPVSRNADIKVDLDEKSGAEYDEALGKLLWHVALRAGETKRLKLIYTVKYPKDKSVTGL